MGARRGPDILRSPSVERTRYRWTLGGFLRSPLCEYLQILVVVAFLTYTAIWFAFWVVGR